MTDELKTKLTPDKHEDFKMFMAFAVQGILSSIPFGVTVDTVAIANAAKNTALAMLQVKDEATK